MLKKLAWLGLSIAGILAVAAVIYLTLSVLTGPYSKPVLSLSRTGNADDITILSGTTVREEYQYLCGDVYIMYLGQAPDKLIGLNKAKLERKYPAKDGWAVELAGETVVLRKQCNEFCPEHKNYRHIGINEGLLAIYEGPLGYNMRLQETEKNMPVDKFPAEYQAKLQQAMDFEKQPPETQIQLKNELEFSGESALHTALENLDELLTGFDHLENPVK